MWPWQDVVKEVFVTTGGADGRSSMGHVLFGLSGRQSFDGHLSRVPPSGSPGSWVKPRRASKRCASVWDVESERNHLLEQAPVATALLVGPNHVFELANPLYQRLVGRNDLLGKSFLQAFPELTGAPLPAVLDRVYATGEPFVVDEMHVPARAARPMASWRTAIVTFSLEPDPHDGWRRVRDDGHRRRHHRAGGGAQAAERTPGRT